MLTAIRLIQNGRPLLFSRVGQAVKTKQQNSSHNSIFKIRQFKTVIILNLFKNIFVYKTFVETFKFIVFYLKFIYIKFTK